MRTRKEIEEELIKLNQEIMSKESIRLNVKSDINSEILLDIRDLLDKKKEE